MFYKINLNQFQEILFFSIIFILTRYNGAIFDAEKKEILIGETY